MMHIKATVILLFVATIHVFNTAASKSKQHIQNICATLHDDTSLPMDEIEKWLDICQELATINDVNQNEIDKISHENINKEQQNQNLNKAIRFSRGIRGTRITGGAGGIRTTPSITRFRNIRTGATITRPNGWLWSRSSLMFLPLALRYSHRSYSRNSRFTTPTTSSETYYYCTSNVDPSIEIQCSSVHGDAKCCEDQTKQEAYCCGGQIPDDFIEDMNKSTQKWAKIFGTLTILTLCMHWFMRRFYS